MSVINTNLPSLNAQRSLNASQSDLNTSIQRLSSGLRINSAKDDAAGLSIATKMDTQIRGMSQAIRNANDGVSLAQTADGALSTIGDALQRMRELTVQALNGTNANEDLDNLNQEFTALSKEVKRITDQTEFNSVPVFDGAARTIQVGANAGQTIAITGSSLTAIDDLTTLDLGATAGDPDAALTAIDDALKALTSQRAELGAAQNSLGYAVSNLQTSVENQSAAKSRIMDTDFAAETAKMTRGQILQQAGTAMLAQANQLPNGVMALLRG